MTQLTPLPKVHQAQRHHPTPNHNVSTATKPNVPLGKAHLEQKISPRETNSHSHTPLNSLSKRGDKYPHSTTQSSVDNESIKTPNTGHYGGSGIPQRSNIQSSKRRNSKLNPL